MLLFLLAAVLVATAGPAGAHTVQVLSTNPDAGVEISFCCSEVCPMILYPTPFSMECEDGSIAQLTAPSQWDEQWFSEWLFGGAPTGIRQESIDVTIGGDITITAAYGGSRPDLVISSIVLNPAAPLAGGTFSAQVTVQNQGDVIADYTSIWLDVWADRPGEAACREAGDRASSFGPLAPGASVTRTFNGMSAGTAGPKTFRAAADSFCNQLETNESNNQATLPYTVGESRTLNVAASGADHAFTVEVEPVDGSGLTHGGVPFTRVYAPGTPVTLTAPAAVAETLFVKWTRDGADFSFSRSTTLVLDADRTMTAVYAPPPAPDYKITGFTMNPDGEAWQGYTFSLSVTVTNVGTAAAPPIPLRLWLDQPVSPGCGAEGFTQRWVSALDVSESQTILFTGLPAVELGTNYLRVYVDPDCSTTDSDRTNNQWDRSYTVRTGTIHTVLIESFNPATGVEVTADPPDIEGKSTGTTSVVAPPVFHYPSSTTATFTAPATSPGEQPFQEWLKDGYPIGTERSVSLSLGLFVPEYHILDARFACLDPSDFAVTNIVLDPPSPAAGTTFSADVTVAKLGTCPTSVGRLGIWLDRAEDATCGETPDEVYRIVDENAPATYHRVFTNLTAPPRGSRVFQAFADLDCLTEESDESNNRFSLAYESADNPPQLDPLGPRPADEGSPLVFTVTATDADGDDLTFSASNLPEGASFDPSTAVFSWTPGYDAQGVYPGVRFQVSDGTLQSHEDVTITVTDVNRAPTLAPIGDRYTWEGEPLVFSLEATDPDGDELVFSAVNLPPGALLDPLTGGFAWTPETGQAGTWEGIVFSVSDGLETDSEAIDVAVRDPVLFFDDFEPGPAATDDSWEETVGNWRVTLPGAWAAPRDSLGLSLVKEEELPSFTSGAIRLLVTLPTGAEVPNGGVLFHVRDASNYRYARLVLRPSGGRLVMGQVGDPAGTGATGFRRAVPIPLRTGKPYRLRLVLSPEGNLDVWRRGIRIGGLEYPQAVPGGVGLTARGSRTRFDDVTVRHLPGWE